MAVKILIKRRMPLDKVQEMDEMLRKLRILATQQEGYISGETLRRLDTPEEFLVISNWQSLEDWQKWLSNRQRKEMQSKIDTILGRETTYEIYQYSLGGV
jgi:heme-degrading monooxygenase HmoA